MTAKGYCTVADVAAITGELTTAQAARAVTLIETAETYIDGQIGRGWLEGERAEEATYYPARYLSLEYWPVESVELVEGRPPGGVDAELTEGTDYEVRDLAAGLIRLETPAAYDRILVTYVPVNAPPADIKLATAEIVAAWMLPALQPGSYGLDSYSLPDLSVKFSRSHYQQAAPPLAQQVIDRYREPRHG